MSTATPLVTIAIPTYNRAGSYLPQALASAIGQTYENIEIIISDNCSTDGTPELVVRQTDPRIRYYRQSQSITPNDNFNFCIERARGEYFLLLLDDELVDPQFVATCIAAANNRDDVGLIRTGLRLIDANGNMLGQVNNYAAELSVPDFFLAWFAGRTSLYLCNTLFKTSLLRSVGGLRSRHNLFQDVLAQVRVVSVARRVDIESVLASSRSHPGQHTYSANVMQWAEDSLDLLKAMENVAGEKRSAVRASGEKFFAAICYSRASAIRRPWERLAAYRAVYVCFNRRYMPPARTVFASTSLYRRLRNIKRRLKGQPRWAAA